MSRKRRTLLLALLTLAAGLLLLRLPELTGWAVISRLSQAFGRPVTVGEVRYHLLPFGVELLDLRVEGAVPALPPFLHVPRVFIVPALASLWRGPLALAELRLLGPRILIHAWASGGDDIPKSRGGGGGGQVHIGRLVIDQGEFILDHRRIPLALDLPDFRGALLPRGDTLAGSVSFGPGSARFGDKPLLHLATEIALNFKGSVLTVESARLRVQRSDLSYTGRVEFGSPPRGEFVLHGPVDLAELDRHVVRTGFGMGGAARFDGTLDFVGSRLRINGRMEGGAGVWDSVPVPRYRGDVSWDETGIHLRHLEVSMLGGSGVLEVELPPGEATASMGGTVERADAEGLWRMIFDTGEARLGGAASGHFALRWPKGRFRMLSGTIEADVAAQADGRTPLQGRFEWRAQDGVQFIEKADLRTPHTQARIAGRIGLDRSLDLALDADSTDLAAADDLVLRLRRALGAPEAQLLGVAGAGAYRGRWRGTLDVPLFEGRFNGQDVTYLGVDWGRADWAGSADPFLVRSHSLVLHKDKGELWLDGQTETGYTGERDGLEVRLRYRDWPAGDFLKALGWDLKLAGLLSGEATVSGRRSAPLGESRVAARQGTYYGIAFEGLEVQSRFEGLVTTVPAGKARVGGGEIGFAGSVTAEGYYDGAAQLRAVDLGSLLPALSPAAAWGGKLTGEATLQGTLLRPRLLGHLSSARLFLGDEGIGAVEASLKGDGSGRVALQATCRSTRVDLAVAGSVGIARPYPVDLHVAARDTSLDPFLRAAYPALPPGLGLVATGSVSLTGPLAQPERLKADAVVPALALLLTDYPVRNRQPVRFGLAEGRLQLEDVQLQGEGTDVLVAGGAAVLVDGPLRLSLRGEADLRAVAAITRRLRGRGAARVSLDVTGTRARPQVAGQLELHGAGLRARGFPHGLEGLKGSVQFTETAARFHDLTGTLAGGPVDVHGEASYAEGRLRSFEVVAAGRGMSFRYPEGLRSTLDGELRFFGDADRQWIAGTVDVRQAVWTRRYDLASELLATRTTLEEPTSLAPNLLYDVKLRAPGTLRLDNNLGTLEASAELSLTGNYGAPVVLGHAEVRRGRVYFQGNTYVIRRGTVDFANPQRIDPLFDIEGETRLRSYRVTLHLSGTLERVYPTLSSDPPLSAVQILSLLAGADESAVVSLATARNDQANLAAAGAATLAAGRISEEVGLERGAERLFGLNRFSIDPAVLKGGGLTNPSARLTVGKRITPDLNVLYSVDLRGAPEQLFSVEYTLSDRFSVLLTRSQVDGTGFDLRLRQSR